MAETKPEPKAGEPCPNCGGELKAAYQPTDEERTAARRREDPIPLRPGSDTGTAEQIKALGDLHTCRECGYNTRIKGEHDDHGEEPAAAGAGNARSRARGAKAE